MMVRADGSKELIALDDGHREHAESWSDLLRSCKQRGMAAPVFAIGDGAMGFWVVIWNSQDREHAEAAARAFTTEYGPKWPKAAAKITEDLDVLLEFFNNSDGRWVHLRTRNPIESTFATGRLRQRVTNGPGSRAAGVAMTFKLIESAQARWRALSASPRRRPARNSTTASSPNVPTSQEVDSRLRNMPIHRS